jgi:hypothetical protein
MTRVRWTAGRDGIAHAHLSAGVTACGASPIAERFAWPETAIRCPTCTADVAAAAERRGDTMARAARLAGFADSLTTNEGETK